jgi:hypothetical protein
MAILRAILLAALMALSGCHSRDPVVEIPPPAMTATGYIAFASVNKHPTRAPVASTKNDAISPQGFSTPDSSPSKAKILPAIKVPDQPGYLRSPYTPGAGLIDARGMPSGSEIYDPYSGNIILVP